jgi:glutamine synthetase
VNAHGLPEPLPDVVRDATEVVLALPDLYGRLQGVRLPGEFFRTEVVRDGYSMCAYLLAADVDMVELSGRGLAIDPQARGFGDFLLRPDLNTARQTPWRTDDSILVLADAFEIDGGPVAVAPRQILRTQLDRLAARGLTAMAGTELEFLVFAESYQDAHDAGYTALRPATRFNTDYALTGLGGLDDLVGRILRGLTAAGLAVESARGECHPGQYEIVFRYGEALTSCDAHVFYKTGAKQIAEAAGRALTFMPKYDDGEGNSCHVHFSLRDEAGQPAFAQPDGSRAPLMDHFLAGVLACAREFTLLGAPTMNAYKRLVRKAFAPSSVGWGPDDRTAAVRVIGAGPSLRFEYRIPGGDANPYLVLAGLVAAGLHGVEQELPLPSVSTGGRLPRGIGEAAQAWRESVVARAAFGDAVVDHLAAAADAELATFAATVTDWERRRGFERL